MAKLYYIGAEKVLISIRAKSFDRRDVGIDFLDGTVLCSPVLIPVEYPFRISLKAKINIQDDGLVAFIFQCFVNLAPGAE